MAIGASGAQAAPAPGALTPAERARVHEEAADILGGYSNVVSRWDGPIRSLVIGGRDGDAARVARETLAEVVAQTSLAHLPLHRATTDVAPYVDAIRREPDYRFASACEPPARTVCANFVVLISDLAAVRELADAVPLRAVYRRSLDEAGRREEPDDDVHCFFAPFQDAGREIVRAFVFVQASLPRDMLRTCLQEEIYQSFGLFSDVSGSRFFSFDNRVEPKRITAFDRALLASVYAPEGRPGEPVFVTIARFAGRLDAMPAGRGEPAR